MPTQQALKTVDRIQFAMGMAYTSMGAWSVFSLISPLHLFSFLLQHFPPFFISFLFLSISTSSNPPQFYTYTNALPRCLLHPSSVLTLCFKPSPSPLYQIITPTTLLLTRCFGAQATTSGLLLSSTTMSRRSFAIFGASMLPYLVFNAWYGFGFGGDVFTKWLWLDFVGNCVFLGGSGIACYLLGGDVDRGKKGV